MNHQLHHDKNRQSMNETLPPSPRRRHHSQYSVDTADQGAGGYRWSGNSGGSGAQRAGDRLDSELEQREYEQQIIRHHDNGVAYNANLAAYPPRRTNRRQPQQQSLSATSSSSFSSSYNSRGTEQLNASLREFNGSSKPQEMIMQRRGYGSYNETAFSPRRQGRVQNVQSQSLNIQTVHEENEFDTIPLVSNEYLIELTSRSTTTQIINEDSETNRLNPNNNNSAGSDISNLYRDSEHSTLHQNVRTAAMRSSQSSDRPTGDNVHSFNSNQSRPHHHRRPSQGDTSGHDFNSNQSMPHHHRRLSQGYIQSSQTRHTGWDRGVSSSLNENQLRQKSREMSSPLALLRRQSTGCDGVYNNGIITIEKQEGLVLNKNPPESMFALARRSTGDVTNVSTDKEPTVTARSLNSDVSASIDKRKKVRLLGAIGVCLIAVIVIVAVYITTSQSPDDDESKQIQPSPQMPLPEKDIEFTLDCNDCISKPVPDIEGRCSPSNLPGSLSACRDACLDAACCYSNVDGEKCYDESNEATLLACGQYQPHCDVLHRPWLGASDGLIPNAPTSLFEGSDWDEICGSDASSLYGRKLSTNNSSQAFTCLEFCLPSKCCYAPIVQSDLASQGLFLSQEEAHQSLATGEYIMTSCTPKNYNSCLDYADACRELISPLSFWQDGIVLELSSISPTSLSPTTSLSPSTSTRRPTLQPTTQRPTTVRPTTRAPTKKPTATDSEPSVQVNEPTSPPSAKSVSPLSLAIPPTTLPPVPPSIVIPIADLTIIRDACTGIEKYNLIAKGEFNARAKCRNACRDGLCCFSDLGLGNEESCSSGNEDVCALYSDCLVLRAKPNDVLDVDNNNSDGPSTPIDDLTSLCSLESIVTPLGMSNCFQGCIPGSWCCGATGETSCFNEFEESCVAYGPCQLMIDKYGGDSAQALPPIPPNNLQYACSYSELHQSGGILITECHRMCDVGICCLDGTCGEGMTMTEAAIADRCAAYAPCRHLLQLPTPPDVMETFCQDKDSSQCIDACSVASCCWSSNDGSCFANFEQRCLSYVPYCAPSMSETGDFPATPSKPPPDICMNGPPSACRNACQAAPSCCFASTVEDNCFSQHEEVSS